MKIYHSKILNQKYVIHENGYVLFEDRVKYTSSEMKEIGGIEGDDLKMIHVAKLIFDGTILNKKEYRELTIKVNTRKTLFFQAVDKASELIKHGLKGHEAICAAADEFKVSESAIGRELGKR